jgi:gas vesicle protein
MKRNMKRFLKAAEVAVGTGLYLLDRSQRFAPHMREKLVDQIDDLRDRAKDTYQAATDRVASVTKSLRRSNTGAAGWHVLRFAVGLGVGIGVAVLLAPAKGEQTRARLAGKAQEFSGNVRRRLAA